MFPGGYCAGLGVGGWLLMIGFWGLLIAVVVWAVTRLFPSTPHPAAPAVDVLAEPGRAEEDDTLPEPERHVVADPRLSVPRLRK